MRLYYSHLNARMGVAFFETIDNIDDGDSVIINSVFSGTRNQHIRLQRNYGGCE